MKFKHFKEGIVFA